MYLSGTTKGVARDSTKGLKLRKEAAASGVPLAQYNLGCQYLSGQDGVDKDFVKAAEYFHQASAKGVVMAMVNLGLLYRQGQGVPRDLAKSKKLLSAAAPHDAFAQQCLEELEAEVEAQDRSRTIRTSQTNVSTP